MITYAHILTVSLLLLIIYIIKMKTNKVEKMKDDINTVMLEAYRDSTAPYICGDQTVEFRNGQVKLQDILTEYNNFKNHVTNMLNASHQYDNLRVLETTYNVNI